LNLAYLYPNNGKKLKLEVFDYDRGVSDDLVGTINVSIKDILD
jgi:Ca2+-dependent lipid-binding protein